MGYIKAFFNVMPYYFLPYPIKRKISDKRLKNLLKYARENSPYYSKLIPDDLDLSKVKPTDKNDIIENFNDIVADRRITLDGILKEIETNPEGGTILGGDYAVALTSGSTGSPTLIVEDNDHQDNISIDSFFSCMKASFPILFISIHGSNWGIGGNLTRNNLKKYPFLNKLLGYIMTEAPFEEQLAVIKKYGPSTIVGYTSLICHLANQILEQNITVKEKMIIVSGEGCSQTEREIIKKAFHTEKIFSIYGCTEGDNMGHECKYGHIHINENCVKLEPVDENDNPVGYDVRSDRVLLTNYMNRVQPIIRYVISDRIIMHKGCPCGDKRDWIEVEGRTYDDFIFHVDGKEIIIDNVDISETLELGNGIGSDKDYRNFQVIFDGDHKLTIRLDYYPDIDKESANNKIIQALNHLFEDNGIKNVEYEFIASLPLQTTKSGKHRKVCVKKPE